MSSDLKILSKELICWLTADWVTPLICAALVKLSLSAKSQKTFRLSICIREMNTKSEANSQLMFLASTSDSVRDCWPSEGSPTWQKSSLNPQRAVEGTRKNAPGNRSRT